jgi:hypothetical protein
MNECGNSAALECAECHQALCASCDEVLHRKASMRGHNRRAMLTSAPRPTATTTNNTSARTSVPSASAVTNGNGSNVSRSAVPAKATSLATTNTASPAAAAKRPGMAEIQVDVLAYMKKGTPFLKYGTYGYPHFRQFQISDDNSKLMWFSSNKKMKDTQSNALPYPYCTRAHVPHWNYCFVVFQ